MEDNEEVERADEIEGQEPTQENEVEAVGTTVLSSPSNPKICQPWMGIQNRPESTVL